MSHRMLCLALCLLALTPGMARGQNAPQAPRYAVTDLGTLPGGAHSGAYAINNAGQIVGWSDAKPDDVSYFDTKTFIHNHAVLWNKGLTLDLGLMGGSYPFSAARAVNTQGQVVGGWEIHYYPGNGGGPGGIFQTFLWQNGKRSLLGLETANAINDKGQVVGQIYVPGSGQRHPALWAHGKKTELGLLPGGREGIANGINAKGWIVGWVSGEASNKVNSDYRAFLYKDGKMMNLDGPPIGEGEAGQNFLQAFAVNDRGQIAGTRSFRAALWELGKWRALGNFPDYHYYLSTAYAINNKSQIVGTADGGGYQNSRAFLYQQGKMYDLNALIPTASGWVLLDARGLNDKGQIVGSGTHGGKNHAFLLTPRP